MDNIKLSPLSCSELANDPTLSGSAAGCNSTKKLLLVDIRPSAQHCSKHIVHSENVNFSSILLRRLLKGVVELSSLLQYDQALHERLACRDSEEERLVLLDSCSSKDSIRTDLVKHGNILAETKHGKESDCRVYFVDGGFESFSAAYPHLCVSSSNTGKKMHSPLGISVSASLPIFSLSNRRPQLQKLRTPSEDSGNRFGPPVEILPHLVLGSAKDSSNLTQLRKMGVTAVLNVSHNCPNHFESLLDYKCIAVQDSYQADLLSKMEAAIEFIDSVKAKNGCVFVHCHAGISRSATISISYIMKTMNWELSRAYEFVKQKRPCISPNLHFMGQLLEFEKQLKGKGHLEVMEMEQQSPCDSCTPNSDVSMPLPCHTNSTQSTLSCVGTSPLQSFSVPICQTTSPMDECDNFFCSSTLSLPSASAPSSLNFDNTDNTGSDDLLQQNHLPQVSCFPGGGEQRVIPSKPNSLPLFQVCQSLTCGRTDPLQLLHFTGGGGGERRAPPPKPTTLPLSQVQHSHTCTSNEGSAHRLKRQRSTPQNSVSLPTTPDTHYKNHLLSSSSSTSSIRVAPYSLQNSPCRVVARLGSRSETCLNYPHNAELSM